MDPDVKVSFPNEILENMKFEQTIFSPENDKIGIAIFSETENDSHIMRIYHLLYDEDEHVYNFIQELTAFSFQSQREVDDLIERLPTLSGIEMLLMLQPIPVANSFLK